MQGKGTITYTYDAAGSKLYKQTVDSTATPVKTTLTTYLGAFNYQSTGTQDTLQFIGHDEGRARWAFHRYVNGATGYAYEYDFFEKDHLGNTRLVLTQQKDTAVYLATMEAAYRHTETALFGNIASTSFARASTPGTYPADNTTSPNDSVARLNGNGQRVGPSLILKVMAGDTVSLKAKSYYVSQTYTATTSSLTDALSALAQGIVNVSGTGHGTVSQLNTTSSPLYGALNTFLTNNEPAPGAGKPKAYLNWVLLDEQLSYVGTYPQSGAIAAGSAAAGTLGTLAYSGIPITKSGYLYIYLSNETQNWDVFFDNLSVQHQTGKLLEETHYYPFGLTMAGISSKAINRTENKYLYNGKELNNKEFSDGSGLEEYDFRYRLYDLQIGRFFNQDRLSDKYAYMSPYQFCSNNPIWLREIDGLEGIKYTETDDQGNKKVIVEKNVVILTEKTKDIPAGATQKQTERIERKNAKIESRNAAKVASITKELNSFYNGEDGKGARDSKGTEVQFKFNVKPLQVANTSGGSRNEITNLALANGLKSSEVQFDGGPNKVAPAAVVTTGSTGGSQGLSNGVFVNVSAGAPSGAFAHEVGHTFTLPDNYQNGGIMASPPNQILPSEVDDIINSSYEK